MSKIIPSTSLKVVSPHKIWDMSCWRYYFWRWIRNLAPKGLNLNYYYGGVLGAGIEQLLLDGKYLKSKINKTLRKESRERLQGHTVSIEDKAEIKLQDDLIKVILKGAAEQPFFKDMRMKKSQIKVSYPILPEIEFHGTIDGLGLYKKKPCSFEFKTAARLFKDTFTTLQYDKQAQGYPIALKKQKKKYPKKCCYLIFRKPQKRIKKNQTQEDFIQEIGEDVLARPEFYYIHYPITLGVDSLKQVEQSLFSLTKILKLIYDSMTIKELLDPNSWGENEKQCTSFGTCPYILLCRYLKRWKTYAHLYKQRDMLYDKEREELKT